MAGLEYINSNLEVDGTLMVETVPNAVGVFVTYDSATKLFGVRTAQQTVSDLGLSTVVSNSHSHANMAVLNGITSALVSNWNTAFGWGNFRDFGLGADAMTVTNLGSMDLKGRFFRYDNTAATSGTTAVGKSQAAINLPFHASQAYAFAMSGTGADAYSNTTAGYTHLFKFWTSLDFTQTDVDNWNTAYGWGNHSGLYALVGRTITAGNGLSGGGSLAANRTITLGTPGDITLSSTSSVSSSSHTHALDSATTTAINNGNTAFGWGDHALMGYALASQLSSYVPTSRTITINGVTQSLSANRTWTIPVNDTITRLRGTASGTYTSGDLTLLAGANTTITQSGSDITIASTNTTYSAGTLALLQAGTNTSNRVWSAKILSDWLVGHNYVTADIITGLASETWVSNNFMNVTHAANVITGTNIANWNTAFGWGNHSGLYALVGRTITAGNGLSGGGSLASNRTITLGTPGDITLSSTSSVSSSSHTHALDSATTAAINNGQTAFGWGDFRDYGLGINSTTTATALTSATIDDPNFPNGLYHLASNQNNYFSSSADVLVMRSGATGYTTQKMQLINSGDVVKMYLRHYKPNSSAWTPWREVITDENLNTQATSLGFIKSSSLSGYLPLTGGTMSGDIAIVKNGQAGANTRFLTLRDTDYAANQGRVDIAMLATNTDLGTNRGAVISMRRTNSLGTLHFEVADNNLLSLIGHSQNVGVSVETPTEKLDVNGNIRVRALTSSGFVKTNANGVLSVDTNTYALASRTITAGNGLSGGGDLTANRTITLGTPGAIGLSSTNSVGTSSHTHALDSATTTAINNGNTAHGWGNYAAGAVTRTTNTNMVSSYYQGLDFDNLDAGNYAIAVASGTNVPSGVGTVRGLFRFGSSHVNLRNDIVIGSSGLAFRTSNNNVWRTVWTDSNFNPSQYVPTSRTITAGNGLSGGGSLASNRTITLGTPSSISLTSTNSVASTSHTHALDSATTTAINNGNTAYGWGDFRTYGLGPGQATVGTWDLTQDYSGFVSDSGHGIPGWSTGRAWGFRTSYNSTAYGVELAMRNGRAAFQTRENGTNSGWLELYHSGNLSTATATVEGLIKLGSNTVNTATAASVSSTASRTYLTQLNSSGQLVVNVPWTNTTYSAGTLALAQAGTNTTNRVWSAKILSDWANSTYSWVSLTGDNHSVRSADTRSVNGLVNTAYKSGAYFEFKTRSVIGLPGSGTYASLMTFAPYSDSSGNNNTAFQIGHASGLLAFRSWGTSWGSWKTLADRDWVLANVSSILYITPQNGIATQGWNSFSTAQHAVSIGYTTISASRYTTSIGAFVSTFGQGSANIGMNNTVNGALSSSIGQYNSLNASKGGLYGIGLESVQEGYFAVGRFNLAPANVGYGTRPEHQEVFAVGTGTDATSRRNAFSVYQNNHTGFYGRAYYQSSTRDASWFSMSNTLVDVAYLQQYVANNGGGGGGNSFYLRSNSNAYLSGNVTLQAGTNITLTQSGNVITLNAAGGGGTGSNNTDQYMQIGRTNYLTSNGFMRYNGLVINDASVVSATTDEYTGRIEAAVLSPNGQWTNPSDDFEWFYCEWGIRDTSRGNTDNAFVTQGSIELDYNTYLEVYNKHKYLIAIQAVGNNGVSMLWVNYEQLREMKVATQIDQRQDMIIIGNIIGSGKTLHLRVNPQFI